MPTSAAARPDGRPSAARRTRPACAAATARRAATGTSTRDARRARAVPPRARRRSSTTPIAEDATACCGTRPSSRSTRPRRSSETRLLAAPTRRAAMPPHRARRRAGPRMPASAVAGAAASDLEAERGIRVSARRQRRRVARALDRFDERLERPRAKRQAGQRGGEIRRAGARGLGQRRAPARLRGVARQVSLTRSKPPSMPDATGALERGPQRLGARERVLARGAVTSSEVAHFGRAERRAQSRSRRLEAGGQRVHVARSSSHHGSLPGERDRRTTATRRRTSATAQPRQRGDARATARSRRQRGRHVRGHASAAAPTA